MQCFANGVERNASSSSHIDDGDLDDDDGDDDDDALAESSGAIDIVALDVPVQPINGGGGGNLLISANNVLNNNNINNNVNNAQLDVAGEVGVCRDCRRRATDGVDARYRYCVEPN